MGAVLEIPGGLAVDGQVHRIAHLHPLTGTVERALTTCSIPDQVLPRSVSAVLAAAVERIGTVLVTPQIAANLTVGDRAFLMLQLAIRFVGDLVWLSPICEKCSSTFDIPVKRSQLPVRAPVGDYPTCSLWVAGRTVELRPPCGEDQCFIAETRPANPEFALLTRCVQRVDGSEPRAEFFRDMPSAHRKVLESALEQAGPEVDCTLPVKCPECEDVQRIELEPYWLGDPGEIALEADVHALAFHYHWGEPEILRLPRDLRRRYCTLIDKDRGLRG